MTDLLFFLTVLPFFYIISYLPGRVIMQLSSFNSRVKFASSFGLSFFLFYLGGLFSYASGISYYFIHSFYLAVFFMIIFYLYRNKNLQISESEIKMLVIFFLGFVFLISIQGLQPYYSGGGSYWDWFEYYFRSLMFYDRLPPMTVIGTSLLPQRMPLYNAAAAFFMSIFGRDYWVFQTAGTLFNFSAFLPCYLICRRLLPKMNDVSLFIFTICLFLLIPHFIFQVTYPWTKAMAAYYLLLGLYFFLETDIGKRQSTIYYSMFFLALGHLVHQVTFPYIGVVILGLLIISIRSKKLIHFFLSVIMHILVLSTWYIWSFETYGATLTFVSAPIIEMTKSIQFMEKIDIFMYNVEYTVLPILSRRLLDVTYNNRNFLVLLYDRVYLYWGATIPSTVSFTMSLYVFYYLYIKFRKIIRYKKLNFVLHLKHLVIFLFIMSGFSPLWFSIKGGGAAGLMLWPVTLLIICYGAFIILKLIRNMRKILIYFFMFLLAVESFLAIGIKALVPKFLLDPNMNMNINIQRDLLSLPEYQRYANFAVHLQNYKLKIDNNLVLLYDRFDNIQIFFLIVFIGGWIFIISMLVKNLLLLGEKKS